MSKRARKAAQKRLHDALFPDGLPRPTCPQPSEKENLWRRAAELRALAARGMKPRAYKREAERLEALSNVKDLQPGAPVIVRLFDSRTVQGTICGGGILNTVGGTKIRVRSGHAVYLVNPEQIIGATKGMKREAGND